MDDIQSAAIDGSFSRIVTLFDRSSESARLCAFSLACEHGQYKIMEFLWFAHCYCNRDRPFSNTDPNLLAVGIPLAFITDYKNKLSAYDFICPDILDQAFGNALKNNYKNILEFFHDRGYVPPGGCNLETLEPHLRRVFQERQG